MPFKAPTPEQTQAIIEAAKQATHFRPRKNSDWLRIIRVVEENENPYIFAEGPNGNHGHLIKDMEYIALAFDKRVTITLPNSHVLAPMTEALRGQLDKYHAMMAKGVDNPVAYAETFAGLHMHFLYECGITDAMESIKKDEWLVEVGCNPMLACMVVHLENLSKATMFFDHGGRTGLHSSVHDLDYWEYLFHSIEILVTALQGVIDNQTTG